MFWIKVSMTFALLSLTACDTFFAIKAHVLDIDSGLPVEGADAELVLDQGFDEPDQLAATDPGGTIAFLMNEPCSAWATLTVRKNGYETWSQQFRGCPKEAVEIHLVPN